MSTARFRKYIEKNATLVKRGASTKEGEFVGIWIDKHTGEYFVGWNTYKILFSIDSFMNARELYKDYTKAFIEIEKYETNNQ